MSTTKSQATYEDELVSLSLSYQVDSKLLQHSTIIVLIYNKFNTEDINQLDLDELWHI